MAPGGPRRSWGEVVRVCAGRRGPQSEQALMALGTPRTRARTRARTLARNSQDSCSPCLGCLGCHASDAMGGGAVSCGPASASCASYAWPRHEAAMRDYELLRIFVTHYEFPRFWLDFPGIFLGS